MKKFGFRRKERLKKNAEFLRVLRGGKKLQNDFLSLSYQKHLPGSPSNHLRLGIVVPKRILHKASARNKIKRWVREAFRQAKPGLETGYDLVVQLRYLPEYIDFEVVKNMLRFLFAKSGLLK
ncbi:MAG: ribonuclease P protein component [Candidatus Omnitrophica bacterium]|nr:ribonuclease P protein component [Candidatus Omnitrophota bacterium]